MVKLRTVITVLVCIWMFMVGICFMDIYCYFNRTYKDDQYWSGCVLVVFSFIGLFRLLLESLFANVLHTLNSKHGNTESKKHE